jgi:hypothetical protein
VSRKNKKAREKPRVKAPRKWRNPKAAKLVLAVFLAAGAAMGLHLARAHLLASPAYAGKLPRVCLSERPEDLPRDIPAGVLADIQGHVAGRSVFADDLARIVHERASADPWIAGVRRVEKHHDGTVVIEAEFRHPFALVATERVPGQFHVVDADGVLLPLGADRVRPGAFIAIDGVATPPPEPGKKWDAPDLADGLRLCKLLKGRPYESQITTIDVANYNGRISPADPDLRMFAQIGQGRPTKIRFGRFPAADGLDYCLSPEQKLANLDAYVQDNGGKLAGLKDWIDLRHDNVHVSIN